MKSREKLRNYLDFLLAMTEKEIKARYKNAFLGFLWIFLNPLLQMLIIGIIFQNFIRIGIDNYFIFLFPGLLAWNFFSYSLAKTTPAIVYERNLIQKANFPREAIPLSIVFANFFHFLISTLFFIVFLLLSGNFITANFLFSAFYFIISVLWLLFFTGGLALLTSALNVKYRDVNFFIQALIILWFYATPVIYSLQILPASHLWLFRLNPLTSAFEAFRYSLIGSSLIYDNLLIYNLSISLIVLGFGVWVFKKESKNFSDWL